MPRAYKDILYETKDHVARITINRPKQYNAFTGDTLKELTLAFEDAGGDDEVGVVVLTGAGDKAFCAGGDVNWEKEGGLERQVLEPYTLHLTVSRCAKPVIARVNGYAVGGGNHLQYFCDFTVAAEHAIFGQNGPRVGSPAGGPIVSYLARIVGHKRAREMWMLCRRYTAKQALDWGLVNAVVPMAELDAEVGRWCEELLALLVVTPEFWREEQQEGARAFLEKRTPDFSRFRRRR
ncbi:MAG: enoyl-CoA hydratase/isomerase family protein [Candidatus Rokubacteria bacterium]|nr:enoyl-CoA hydratase/isomerase family protein [Candidatus Rokubacteria bacterium]